MQFPISSNDPSKQSPLVNIIHSWSDTTRNLAGGKVNKITDHLYSHAQLSTTVPLNPESHVRHVRHNTNKTKYLRVHQPNQKGLHVSISTSTRQPKRSVGIMLHRISLSKLESNENTFVTQNSSRNDSNVSSREWISDHNSGPKTISRGRFCPSLRVARLENDYELNEPTTAFFSKVADKANPIFVLKFCSIRQQNSLPGGKQSYKIFELKFRYTHRAASTCQVEMEKRSRLQRQHMAT